MKRQMMIKEIDFSNIDEQLKNTRYANIIYGAGYNGKYLYNLFQKYNIAIEAFYDDDKTRCGKEYCGKKILSESEIRARENNQINIIISSMYIPQIYEKCTNWGFENIYAALGIILDKDTDDFQFIKYNTKEYRKRLRQLSSKFEDEKSKQYFQIIEKTIREGKANADITELYCGEKQYFLQCFKNKLDGIFFIDAGAYTGDTVREMLEEGIRPSGGICFEADGNNYQKLQNFCGKIGKFIICENKALWNERAILGMKFNNYNARIDEQSEERNVEAVAIDEYVVSNKIGFIKMDIEGAERKALQGGEKTIKRDRPILAISIYHGMDDIVDIPEMLFAMLENYKFIVRHHSFTYSETVMYCVPNEREDIILR